MEPSIPLDSVGASFLVLGVLFVLRYVLALRRIFQEVPRPAGSGLADFLRPPGRGVFGAEMEPNRRYATRQYWQGAIFLVGGVAIFGWLLATGAPIDLGPRA